MLTADFKYFRKFCENIRFSRFSCEKIDGFCENIIIEAVNR